KMPNIRSKASMTHEDIKDLVTRQVAKEMETPDAARNLEPLNEIRDEGENGGNRGNGNEGNGNGGNGNW
ncbi:hypothetical protein Tco_0440781, partial [Tanacetum coccineum]